MTRRGTLRDEADRRVIEAAVVGEPLTPSDVGLPYNAPGIYTGAAEVARGSGETAASEAPKAKAASAVAGTSPAPPAALHAAERVYANEWERADHLLQQAQEIVQVLRQNNEDARYGLLESAHSNIIAARGDLDADLK